MNKPALAYCCCDECRIDPVKGPRNKAVAIIIMMAWQGVLYGPEAHARQAAACNN